MCCDDACAEVRTWYGNYGISLDLTVEQINACAHSGPCDDDVEATIRNGNLDFSNCPADKVRQELSEYGAWDAEELADDNANRQRLVWIAAADMREELR